MKNPPQKESYAFLKKILRIIVLIFLPPFGVWLRIGLGPQFWINILLTLCGFLPGLVHGIYVYSEKPPS